MELGYSSALEVLWLREDLVVWYVTYPYTTLYNNSRHFFLSKVTNVLFDIGHWLHHYRFHALGHCASPWRTRCLVSCQWSILHLRCTLRRPSFVRMNFYLFCNSANDGMKVALQLVGTTHLVGLQFFLSSSRQRVSPFNSGGLISTSE